MNRSASWLAAGVAAATVQAAAGSEILLTCEGAPDCIWSCRSERGDAVLVHGEVRRAVVSELADQHSLVTLQRPAPKPAISLLVADVSRCELDASPGQSAASGGVGSLALPAVATLVGLMLFAGARIRRKL